MARDSRRSSVARLVALAAIAGVILAAPQFTNFAGAPTCVGRSCNMAVRGLPGFATLEAPDLDEEPMEKAVIYVCTHTACQADGAKAALQMLRENSPSNVEIRETGCLGPCSSGPNVLATPRKDVLGGASRDKAKRVPGPGNMGMIEQPAGVCFTKMNTAEDASLLAAWGFESVDQGPLGALKLLLRSSQLDQVPWPILLYVGFNVIRLPVNVLFHVDILSEIASMFGKGR